jgi:hypothetical protein
MSATTLTWIGGGNNHFYNANDWSPAGMPRPGDTLDVNATTTGPTINTFLALGDTLTDVYTVSGDIVNYNITDSSLTLVTDDPTIVPYSPGLNVTANGIDQLAIPDFGGDATINLEGKSVLFLTGDMQFARLGETGGAGSTLINDGGMELLFGGSIQSNLSGYGSIDVNGFADEGGSLTLGGSVGSGQTISLTRGAPFISVLTVDHPQEFAGTVVLGESSQVTLDDLTATSYNYGANVVTLYSGNKAVDSIKLDNPTNGPLYVTSSSGSVTIANWAPGGTVTLPLHVGV